VTNGKAQFSTLSETLFVSALAFIYLLLTLSDFIFFPPVWDAAPGLFAPAIYLLGNL